MTNELDLNKLFEGRSVPGWYKQLEVSPVEAVDNLLTGSIDDCTLLGQEPDLVILRALRRFPCHEFVSYVDSAIRGWIVQSWRKKVGPDEDATVTAEAWCVVGRVIESSELLSESAQAIRLLVRRDPFFLEALSSARSRDPLGCCLRGIAHYQVDDELRETWWELCSLPPSVPWYRGECGVYGLRNMPAGGDFPEHVGHGLARLADALCQRVNDGWLEENLAHEEWRRVVRQAMLHIAFPARWVAFWESVVRGPEREGSAWVSELVFQSGTGNTQRGHGRGAYRALVSDPEWGKTATGIASDLSKAVPGAIERAEALVERQLVYARQTGDASFLAKSCCNFASCLNERRDRLDVARTWAELARVYDPWNPYVWSTSAEIALSQGDSSRALELSFEAVERFPFDIYVRDCLAKAFLQLGDHRSASTVSLETVERFPNDLIGRHTLVRILLDSKDFERALVEARVFVKMDEADSYGWLALAEAQFALKDYTGCLESARRAAALTDLNAGPLYFMTQALWESEDRTRAVEMAICAADRFPNNAYVASLLLRYLVELRNFAEAESRGESFLDRFRDNEHISYLYLRSLIGNRKFNEAAKFGLHALSKFPDTPVIDCDVVLALLKVDRGVDAARVAEGAYLKWPDNERVVALYIRALISNNELDKAVGTANSALATIGESRQIGTLLSRAQALLRHAREEANEPAMAETPDESEAILDLCQCPEPDMPICPIEEARSVESGEMCGTAYGQRASVGCNASSPQSTPTPSEESASTELGAPVDRRPFDDVVQPSVSVLVEEPVGPEKSICQPLSSFDFDGLEILLTDSYMLRLEARRMKRLDLRATPGEMRDSLRDRLSRVLGFAEVDSRMAGQGALTLAMLDRDELESALRLLAAARRRFPGSPWTAYAWAWVVRQMATESGIQPDSMHSLERAWSSLKRLDNRLAPLATLGLVRTWGGLGENSQLRESLGELAYQLNVAHKPRLSTLDGKPRLSHQWNQRVMSLIGIDKNMKGAENLPEDLAGICSRIADPLVALRLDELEQEYLGGMAA